MKKLILSVFGCVLFFFIHAKTNCLTGDSAKERLHFHLALSVKPVINWISIIDSDGSFFNSPVLFEPQISYKRHYLLFGFNFNNHTRRSTVNEIPNELQKLNYSMNPGYFFSVFVRKKWQVMAGLNFMYTFSFTEYRLYTSLETQTETTKTTEKGYAPALRINYRLNKFISIETEFAYFNIWSAYSFIKNYPLTPSLQSKSAYTYHRTQGAAPSNLLVKITF